MKFALLRFEQRKRKINKVTGCGGGGDADVVGDDDCLLDEQELTRKNCHEITLGVFSPEVFMA